MKVAELKKELTDKLAAIGATLDQYQKLEVAIKLKLSAVTVGRYMSGNEEEVRNLELAESILDESTKIADNKTSKDE